MTFYSLYKQRGNHTGLLWTLYIFLFAVFFISYSTNFFFSVDEAMSGDVIIEAIEEGTIERRIALIALGIFAIFSLLRKSKNILRINGSLGWLIIFFICWAVLSVAWADNTALTVRRVGVLLLLSLGGIAVAERFSIRDIIVFAFFSCGLIISIGLVAEIALGTFEPLNSEYRFAGVMHYNPTGMHAAVLLISSISLVQIKKTGKLWYLAVAIAAFAVLFLTKSRTAFASGFFAASALVALGPSRSRWLAIIYCAVLILLGSFFVFGDELINFGKNFFFLGRVKEEEIFSLTYRIPIWKACLPYIAERPLLGYGYNSFWTQQHTLAISAQAMQQWTVPHSHSGYIEIILGLGIVGTGVYVLILVLGIARSIQFYKASGNYGYAFTCAILIWLSMNMLLEAINTHPHIPNFITIVILAKLGFTGIPMAKK
jgi:O-antigen ligase